MNAQLLDDDVESLDDDLRDRALILYGLYGIASTLTQMPGYQFNAEKREATAFLDSRIDSSMWAKLPRLFGPNQVWWFDKAYHETEEALHAGPVTRELIVKLLGYAAVLAKFTLTGDDMEVAPA